MAITRLNCKGETSELQVRRDSCGRSFKSNPIAVIGLMSATHEIRDASTTSGIARIVPTHGWIIGPIQDLLLFLGTPLLLIVVFGLAERYWNLAAVAVFSTVMAMGHYLPGLMRAYGDPALFQRFRWRFLLAPVILYLGRRRADARGIAGVLAACRRLGRLALAHANLRARSHLRCQAEKL